MLGVWDVGLLFRIDPLELDSVHVLMCCREQ